MYKLQVSLESQNLSIEINQSKQKKLDYKLNWDSQNKQM